MPNDGSRTNQSRFVLLGMLQTEPGTGYDLKRRIDQSVSFFWRESWGQIYPSLRRLEAEKLVKGQLHPGNGKPDRRVYAITRNGTKVLKGWLAEPVKREKHRNELLLKLFFGETPTPDHNLRLLSERSALSEETLATYEALELELAREHEGTPGLPWWLMTLRHGIHHMRAEIAWCEESAQQVRALQMPS